MQAVLTNVRALIESEDTRLNALRQATSAAEVRAAFAGASYAAQEPKQS
jgi:hypothetical protein